MHVVVISTIPVCCGTEYWFITSGVDACALTVVRCWGCFCDDGHCIRNPCRLFFQGAPLLKGLILSFLCCHTIPSPPWSSPPQSQTVTLSILPDGHGLYTYGRDQGVSAAKNTAESSKQSLQIAMCWCLMSQFNCYHSPSLSKPSYAIATWTLPPKFAPS